MSAGRPESAINEAIYALARDVFGVERHWHKRVVRAGRNTLCPYRENPPDLIVAEEDIVFVDLGPVFEDWEADYGRTFVIGEDPGRHAIRNAVESCWELARAHYRARPAMSGAELYAFVSSLAAERGYAYGSEHCGHLVGEFPHEGIAGDDVWHYVHPDNDVPMSAPDGTGAPREWILEMHFVDPRAGYGAFVERLLTVD